MEEEELEINLIVDRRRVYRHLIKPVENWRTVIVKVPAGIVAINYDLIEIEVKKRERG